MKRPSENKWDTMREKIIGLGEQSIRKGYYPELQQRISELEKFRLLLDQSNDIIFLIDIISGVLTDVDEPSFKPVNLTEIVKDAKPLLIMAIGKECNVEYNLKSEINYIKADETQMLQLIMNLAINSKEAMLNPYKFITIKTDEMECNKDYFADSYWFQDVEEGIYVCLEVADTGCGMSKKVISRIFDPFFTTKSEGKGLGLATVLGIVRKHKGAIKINSKPGEGTRFQILFPALLQPGSSK